MNDSEKPKNTNKKRFAIIGGIAAVIILGIGGFAIAQAVDDDLDGDDYDRATEAALDHVGEGKITDADRGDDDDVEAYDVEVTRPDGSDIDVRLDEDFEVIGSDDDDDRDDGDRDRNRDDRDSDDRTLSDDQQKKASDAAQAEVDGRVVDVDASDDRIDGATAAYEVEIRADDGNEWVVWLDGDFKVLDRARD